MNTASNVFLLTAAAALVALGLQTISTELLTGAIEIVLGIVCFTVYEIFPPAKAQENISSSVS